MGLVKTFQTRSGPMLGLATDQYITKAFELYGEYNRAEWLMLKQAIRPGMTVVEIGANMGSHSVDLARACAPGPFYAFEPQPRLFQILCANLALNDIGNALAYPEACGAAEGEAVIPFIRYDMPGNFGGMSLRETGQKGIKVRVRALDSLELPTLGLLKVDVEGFECQVIEGARETIRRCQPVIYIENDRADQQQALISSIAALDYAMFWHLPLLFDPDNFRRNPENIYPGIASINMLCLPKGLDAQVQGMTAIDPDNWTNPIKRKHSEA